MYECLIFGDSYHVFISRSSSSLLKSSLWYLLSFHRHLPKLTVMPKLSASLSRCLNRHRMSGYSVSASVRISLSVKNTMSHIHQFSANQS